MDTSLGGVRHPTTGQDLSVEDAVKAGVLDIPHASYNNVTEDNQSGSGKWTCWPRSRSLQRSRSRPCIVWSLQFQGWERHDQWTC